MAKYCLILVLLNSMLAIGATSNPELSLQTKLNNIHQMTANFKQTVTDKGEKISSSVGSMALNRPGRLRWETKKPMEQLIIADGQKLWIYDLDLEQVTVKNQDAGLSETAALFLSNYTTTKAFKVNLIEKDASQTYTLEAKSTKENFRAIILTFNNNILEAMQMLDHLGQLTTINFTNILINSKLDHKLFQFSLPKGVDVLYGG